MPTVDSKKEWQSQKTKVSGFRYTVSTILVGFVVPACNSLRKLTVAFPAYQLVQ